MVDAMRHSRFACVVVSCISAIAICTVSSAGSLSRGIGRSAPATQPASVDSKSVTPQERFAPDARTSDFVDSNPYPGGLDLGYSCFTPITETGVGLGPYPSGIYIGPVWASGYRHHWHAPTNATWNGSLSTGLANSVDGVPMGPMNTQSIAGGGPRHGVITHLSNSPTRSPHLSASHTHPSASTSAKH